MSARGTELLDEILTRTPQERAQLAERILIACRLQAHEQSNGCVQTKQRLDSTHTSAAR